MSEKLWELLDSLLERGNTIDKALVILGGYDGTSFLDDEIAQVEFLIVKSYGASDENFEYAYSEDIFKNYKYYGTTKEEIIEEIKDIIKRDLKEPVTTNITFDNSKL